MDIDRDGESKPLTDGLLLIRYLFGLPWDSLISGALGRGAERDTVDHGGKLTGPRTQQGRNLCGAAKTLHGRETRAIRAKRQQALAELKLLERMGRRVGVF